MNMHPNGHLTWTDREKQARAHIDYAAGGATAAAVEQESELDYWQDRAYRAEKSAWHAEQDLSDARHLLNGQMEAREADAEAYCDRTRELDRPLTADDITDEMVDRAGGTYVNALRNRGYTASMKDSHTREVFREALTAALTPPPSRPEGAEDHEVTIIDTLGAGRLTDDEVATLADALATEENR